MGAIRKAFKVKNAVRHPIHTATRPVRRTVRKAVVPKSVRTASYKVRSVSTAVHNPISTAIRSLDSDNLKKRKAGTSATKSTYSRAPYKRSTKNTTRNGSSYSYSGGSSFDYDESYVTDSEGTSPVIYENKQSSIGSRIIDGLIEALAPWLLLFGVPFLFWLVIMPFTFLPGGGNYDKYIAPALESSQHESRPSYEYAEEQAASDSFSDPALLRDNWRDAGLEVSLIDIETGEDVTDTVTEDEWDPDGLISYNDDEISMYVKMERTY